MAGFVAEFGELDLEQPVEVLAQLALSPNVVREVDQLVRIVGGFVPLVVVVFEGCVLAEQFGALVDVAGPVDTAANAVVAGVLRLAIEEAPDGVAGFGDQVGLGGILGEEDIVPRRRRRIASPGRRRCRPPRGRALPGGPPCLG